MSFRVVFLLRILLLGFSTTVLNAQILNNVTKPALTKYSLAEKIYLQIDNTIYQTGETIWFKAIVSRSFDNSLTDISEILNVELVDSNERVIERRLLKLKEGIGSGSFELQEGYNSGKYLIRAYTNWNRNFEADFIFSQSIDVINTKETVESDNPILNVAVHVDKDLSLTADIDPKVVNPRFKGKLKMYIDTGKIIDSVELSREKEKIYKLNYMLPSNTVRAKLSFNTKNSGQLFETGIPEKYSKTIIIDENYIDVQFFPEGGKLVNGLVSTVAFKSVDNKGIGYKISGDIKSSKGISVTTFNSNNLGLGTFKLLPEAGINYYAEVNNNDITYKYSLPIAKNSGSVLSVVKLKNDLRVLLASNTKEIGGVRIQTESRGVKYHDLNFTKKDTITALISSESLPEGIEKITVLNNQQIICERLIFNTKPSVRLDLKVSSNNNFYRQRDKTTLNIHLDSMQVSTETTVSVLVLDKERTEISKRYKPNILAYLLLNSELKGFIENPMYYFGSANKGREMDLDALMLTQGWRSYKYQKTKPTTNYTIQPEKNLVISGTIGEYFNPKKRPKEPLDLNLIIQDEPPQIYSMEIPESGKYNFKLDDIYDSNAEFFMQVVDKKGTPIDFNINLDKKWNPEIRITEEQQIAIPDYITVNFTERIEADNKIQSDYETTFNTITLDEAVVKGYKMTPEREEFVDFHGEPDVVIDGKVFNENAPDWNTGVFSVLKSPLYSDKIEVLYTRSLPPFMYAWDRRYDFTYVLVDNIPVDIRDYSRIQDIPADEVTGIDIYRDPKDKNRYCTKVFPFVLSCPKRIILLNIYTKSGRGIFGITETKGVLVNTIEGFSKTVEFYAPNYENITSQDWVIPDNRSVIHWSPDIKLDKDGKYTVEYYNDDHIGEVTVIVEAISKDGKIGYTETTYTLEEVER